MPNLIAYDLAGVQPMSGPTGLIFAMRSRYQTRLEPKRSMMKLILHSPVRTSDATKNGGSDRWYCVGMGTTAQPVLTPAVLNPVGSALQPPTTLVRVCQLPMLKHSEIRLNAFNQMAFSIEKVTVTAKSRALKAEYSLELAQDLKAIHGLNAEAELANILSTEILAEINREVIRTIYKVAEQGAVQNTATAGQFDLDIDSNGRWSVEKFKGLLFQIERDANAIAQRTRRGKGNTILCSADVASALTMGWCA